MAFWAAPEREVYDRTALTRLYDVDIEGNAKYSEAGKGVAVKREGEDVLEHFHLHVPAGMNVAIVGETRAGKSTLVNLMGRFF